MTGGRAGARTGRRRRAGPALLERSGATTTCYARSVAGPPLACARRALSLPGIAALLPQPPRYKPAWPCLPARTCAQMAVPQMQSSTSQRAFNLELANADYDLRVGGGRRGRGAGVGRGEGAMPTGWRRAGFRRLVEGRERQPTMGAGRRVGNGVRAPSAAQVWRETTRVGKSWDFTLLDRGGGAGECSGAGAWRVSRVLHGPCGPLLWGTSAVATL